MANSLQYTRVVFKQFKAFEQFTLKLRPFNILVGPNNAGKSTILAAFRILAAGLRKANTRRAQLVNGPEGQMLGYSIDLAALSIGEENIFFNYSESDPALVTFSLTENKSLMLYFPEPQACFLIADDPQRTIQSPSAFKSAFNCPIGFVPILGPVEHNERLYEKEAARLALYNYRAARNFRNIWHHYPDNFESFRNIFERHGREWILNRRRSTPRMRSPFSTCFVPSDASRAKFSGLDSGFKFGVRC